MDNWTSAPLTPIGVDLISNSVTFLSRLNSLVATQVCNFLPFAFADRVDIFFFNTDFCDVADGEGESLPFCFESRESGLFVKFLDKVISTLFLKFKYFYCWLIFSNAILNCHCHATRL